MIHKDELTERPDEPCAAALTNRVADGEQMPAKTMFTWKRPKTRAFQAWVNWSSTAVPQGWRLSIGPPLAD